MNGRRRLRDLGVAIGRLPPGPRNAITDVPGVRVGHTTLIHGEGPLIPGTGPVRTGVTAILPHPGNLYTESVTAAIEVINGFGKAVGLLQVAELGELETPILLTNTLNVGLAADALVGWMLAADPGIGIDLPTVNPVVLECNDGYLNDIQGRHVKAVHVQEALGRASAEVAEGNVGAGTGMSAFGFKGGIGTSSRRLSSGAVVGCLVLTNFGKAGELRLDGSLLPLHPSHGLEAPRPGDGSVIIIVATDLGADARQLGRVARRAVVGLARVGSGLAHGSGDFVLAFATPGREGVRDADLAEAFTAAAEATEEAVLNALCRAETMTGRDGHVRHALPLAELQVWAQHRGAGREE